MPGSKKTAFLKDSGGQKAGPNRKKAMTVYPEVMSDSDFVSKTPRDRIGTKKVRDKGRSNSSANMMSYYKTLSDEKSSRKKPCLIKERDSVKEALKDKSDPIPSGETAIVPYMQVSDSLKPESATKKARRLKRRKTSKANKLIEVKRGKATQALAGVKRCQHFTETSEVLPVQKRIKIFKNPALQRLSHKVTKNPLMLSPMETVVTNLESKVRRNTQQCDKNKDNWVKKLEMEMDQETSSLNENKLHSGRSDKKKLSKYLTDEQILKIKDNKTHGRKYSKETNINRSIQVKKTQREQVKKFGKMTHLTGAQYSAEANEKRRQTLRRKNHQKRKTEDSANKAVYHQSSKQANVVQNEKVTKKSSKKLKEMIYNNKFNIFTSHLVIQISELNIYF